MRVASLSTDTVMLNTVILEGDIIKYNYYFDIEGFLRKALWKNNYSNI